MHYGLPQVEPPNIHEAERNTGKIRTGKPLVTREAEIDEGVVRETIGEDDDQR